MASHRYALRLSPAQRDALLPLLDPDTALHLQTTLRTIQGDVEVPVSTEHLRTLARVASEHPELHGSTKLVNVILSNL